MFTIIFLRMNRNRLVLASRICLSDFLVFNRVAAECAIKDCLWRVSRECILSVQYLISFSFSLLCLVPILINLPLMEHLWASHTIMGSTLGVALWWKNLVSIDFNLGSCTGSVNNEEFNLHVLGLAKVVDNFRVIEMGAWSEIDCIPILASEVTWRSLSDMNK